MPIQGLLDIGGRQYRGRRTVGLQGRAALDGGHLEQLSTFQAEELFRVFVRVDEAAFVRVKHDDRLWSMIDEQTIARLALPHCLLRLATFRDIAQTEYKHLPA